MVTSVDSPITNSDASADSSPEWSRFLATCIGTLVIGGLLLYAFMIAIDPYDSGKFGFLGIAGVDDRNTHTADASRARDVNFDSAIIGNSTAHLLNPAELSQATGLRFVQLTTTGAGPREEFAVLDFFLRHHPHVGALVVVTDPSWCAHERAEPWAMFPYWLYGKSSLPYARRLISWQTIQHAFQRLAIGLGWHKRMDPAGAFRAEDVWPPGEFHETNLPKDPLPAATTAGRAVFPEVSLLDQAVQKLPPDAAVVLVVPPTLYPTVPQPGTVAAAEKEACNAALRQVVAGRPHSNFINYRVDNAMTRDRANFVDFIHYRPVLAAKMQEGIAASIKQGNAARIDF
jgi:hypothetical protein